MRIRRVYLSSLARKEERKMVAACGGVAETSVRFFWKSRAWVIWWEVAFEGTTEKMVAEEGGGLPLKRRHRFFWRGMTEKRERMWEERATPLPPDQMVKYPDWVNPTWRPYPNWVGGNFSPKVLDWISLLLKPMKVEPDLISFKNINKLTLSEFDSHGTNSYIWA